MFVVIYIRGWNWSVFGGMYQRLRFVCVCCHLYQRLELVYFFVVCIRDYGLSVFVVIHIRGWN